MKKILSTIFFALLFIITTNYSFAQDRSFGIKGGVAAYQLVNEVRDASSTSDPIVAFEAGIFGDFPINRILSIQPEVVFVQKGGEESDDALGTSSATLSYVDVPLILKINAPVSDNFKPYIFGGPFAGYLVDATSASKGNNQDISEFLEEFNYGVKVGLGVNIGRVVIDARYDMGFANIYKETEEAGDFGDFTLTTTGVVLSLGITF